MTDLPDLKFKALVNFPAKAIGGAGIDVEKANGNFVIDLAYADFAPPVGGIPDPAHQNALLWNNLTDTYTLAPVSLIGSGGSVPEAPNDGVQYGRQSLTWTPVAATGGALPATAVPLVESGTGAVGTSVKYAREDHVHPASGGSGSVTPAALTRTNDTNVTLTLGGTPNTALLQATSITVGWSGTLGLSRGGFGGDVSASTGVPIFTAGTISFQPTTGSGNIVRASAPAFTSPPTGVRYPLMYSGGNTTQAAGTTLYYGSGVSGSGAPAGSAIIVPQSGTLGNLFVQCSGAPGASQSYTATLYDGATGPTAVTCTISGAAAAGNDTTHTASVTAGQQIFLQVASSASAAAVTLAYGFTLTV